jgi:hypothetical protein
VNRDIGEARAAFGRPYGLDIDYDSTVLADQVLKVAPVLCAMGRLVHIDLGS